MFVILFAALMHDANIKYDLSAKWKVFCEKHLIADDPSERRDDDKKDGEE